MRSLALLMPFALAACVEVESPPDPGIIAPPLPPEDSCGASQLQGLRGQSEDVLQTMKFGGPVRIIQPGMAVTMDYNPARLNIEIDESGKIHRISCG
ncbi:MAG: I78 family peptidase inhibitor [Paracoccaceae bacterium]